MTAKRERCVVLGVSGSVAIYKACDVASKLTQAGVVVRTILTASAAKLVSPILFRAITGRTAVVTEFAEDAEAPMLHIDLAQKADLFLVAPASAGTIGRLANGIADDLLSSAALVLDAKVPRAIAPAMNPNMWEAPPVVANVAKLRSWGWDVVEPGTGWTACGVEGKGRLAEPAEIVAFALRKLRK
ncbi:MAG TPA: flavoprotein [Planctomycetota bacterium]|nr:flavoprotein [Planctomycetota bacterium]